MPQKPDAVSDAVASAKKELAKASDPTKFPTAPKTTPVAKAKPSQAPKPSSMGDPSLGPSLMEKQKNIQQYQQNVPTSGGTSGIPQMHKGGDVPKDGVYELQKGEHITPASTSGRNSEYRRVYIARRQKKGEGGNSPAPAGEEKHDQKKATEKGIKDKTSAGVGKKDE